MWGEILVSSRQYYPSSNAAANRLIVVGSQHLASFRIDPVCPNTRRAFHGFIVFAAILGRIVGDEALHPQVGNRAAVNKGRQAGALQQAGLSQNGQLLERP